MCVYVCGDQSISIDDFLTIDQLTYMYWIWPAQLSCLGGSVGRISAQYAECCGLKSHVRLFLFFLLGKREELSLDVVALLCLVSMTEYTCTCM